MKINISLSREYKDRPYTGKSGLYSAVEPDTQSKKAIQKMCDQCFNEWFERKYYQDLEIEPDLHCTIMYSPDNVTNNLEDASWFLPTDVYNANAKRFRWWAGHDESGYLILELDSQELLAEHTRYRDAGCKPTFDDYVPHITIKKDFNFESDDEQKSVLRLANLTLRKKGLSLTLTNQVVQDIEKKS